MRKTPTLERSKLRGESLVIVGTGMGYNSGGYEHFFKGHLSTLPYIIDNPSVNSVE